MTAVVICLWGTHLIEVDFTTLGTLQNQVYDQLQLNGLGRCLSDAAVAEP